MTITTQYTKRCTPNDAIIIFAYNQKYLFNQVILFDAATEQLVRQRLWRSINSFWQLDTISALRNKLRSSIFIGVVYEILSGDFLWSSAPFGLFASGSSTPDPFLDYFCHQIRHCSDPDPCEGGPSFCPVNVTRISTTQRSSITNILSGCCRAYGRVCSIFYWKYSVRNHCITLSRVVTIR